MTGLQNNNSGVEKYIQVSATAKHFFVFNYASGVEQANVVVSNADLRLSYLVAFKHLVQAAKVESVMCSYNAINGPPACVHPYLQQVLRDEWGFAGFVVSDLGAIDDITNAHHWTNDSVNGSALAINAGCDLNLGSEYGSTMAQAVQRGLTTVGTLDRSLARLFSQRIRSGAWDPPELVPWSKYGLEQVDTPANRQLAREAAMQGAVLLKNDGGFLPFTRYSFPRKRIAVIGPNADRPYGLLGNYPACLDGPYSDVDPLCTVHTPLDGITAYAAKNYPELSVSFDLGIPDLSSYNTSLIDAAIASAQAADVAIVVIGLGTCALNGAAPPNCLEAEGYDRESLLLPPIQQLLLDKLSALGTPVVLVLFGGSTMAISSAVLNPGIPSIFAVFYPGEESGPALAALLFGDESPSGRLAVTWPLGDSQLPAYTNDSMLTYPGRSYRYSVVIPLFAFGYGLSYTQFRYSSLSSDPHAILNVSRVVPGSAETVIGVGLQVSNVGARSGREVVECYVSVLPFTSVPGQAAPPSLPRTALSAFHSLRLAPARHANLSSLSELSFTTTALRLLDDSETESLLQGVYVVQLGGAQPGSRGMHLDGSDMHAATVSWTVPNDCQQQAQAFWDSKRQQQMDEQQHGKDAAQALQGTDRTLRQLGQPLRVRVGRDGEAVSSWAEMRAAHDRRGQSGDMSVTLTVEESIAGGLLGTFTVC